MYSLWIVFNFNPKRFTNKRFLTIHVLLWMCTTWRLPILRYTCFRLQQACRKIWHHKAENWKWCSDSCRGSEIESRFPNNYSIIVLSNITSMNFGICKRSSLCINIGIKYFETFIDNKSLKCSHPQQQLTL